MENKTTTIAEIIAEINARLDALEIAIEELTGKKIATRQEAESRQEQFAKAIEQGATAEELLESAGLNTFAGCEEALAVFEANRELTRGRGNKVYNDLCRLHILERGRQLERLRLGYEAEGSVARLAQYLEWDEVHSALQKYANKLDLGQVIINEKYQYFKLSNALLVDAGFEDMMRVSFEGLTPHEAAKAFRERLEQLAEASADLRKASNEKTAAVLREKAEAQATA